MQKSAWLIGIWKSKAWVKHCDGLSKTPTCFKSGVALLMPCRYHCGHKIQTILRIVLKCLTSLHDVLVSELASCYMMTSVGMLCWPHRAGNPVIARGFPSMVMLLLVASEIRVLTIMWRRSNEFAMYFFSCAPQRWRQNPVQSLRRPWPMVVSAPPPANVCWLGMLYGTHCHSCILVACTITRDSLPSR